MDHQGQFRRAALEAGIPPDEIGRFTQHLRMSIRLSGSPGDRPVGQFGGSPRLPVGRQWPVAGGSRLPFVFSVDCAALPRIDGFGLPADGSLLFFLDHEKDHLAGAAGDQSHARVVYVPADVDTEVVEQAENGEQYDVGATLMADLPDWDRGEDEDDLQLARDLPHLDELRALASELWPPGNGLASAFLGGYADDEVIRSFAEQILAGREQAGEIVIPVAKWYSHVEAERHRLTGEWLSLARFPLADGLYSGGFVIRHDDLAAGRLERALPVTEFSE